MKGAVAALLPLGSQYVHLDQHGDSRDSAGLVINQNGAAGLRPQTLLHLCQSVPVESLNPLRQWLDAGLTANHSSGWFVSIRARHFGDSPLVEDNSAKSPTYTTFDLQVGYQQSQKWLVALGVFNLFDKKWNDIEYYYASRLQNEPAARPDYVVHPGVPLTLRAHFQYFLQCYARRASRIILRDDCPYATRP